MIVPATHGHGFVDMQKVKSVQTMVTNCSTLLLVFILAPEHKQ